MKKAIMIHTSDFRGDHSADIIQTLIVDEETTVKQLLEMITGGESITITHDFVPNK